MRPAAALGAAAAVLLMPAPAEAASGGQRPAAAATRVGAPATWTTLTLDEALRRLRSLGLSVLYCSEVVRPDMTVEEEPAGREPREILAGLLAPLGLTAREGPDGLLFVVPSDSGRGVIHVQARAGDTGRALAGAEIRLLERDEGGKAGIDGRYQLRAVPAGTYTVEARAPGYLEAQIEGVSVAAGGEVEVPLVLEPRPRFAHELVVEPSRYELLHPQPEARQFLDREEVRRLPHLSDDVFRVFHRLPGVAAGDISAAFSIRGGQPRETVFVLDGLEILEPYHFRDFQRIFSIVDSEAVEGAELMTGGFPVEYGDRLSGVVELSSVVPERPRRSLGASLLAGRFMAEGTGELGRTSWLVSARRGYLDWVFRWIEQIEGDFGLMTSPRYYDAFASLRRPAGARGLLSAYVLGAYDRVHYLEDEGLEDARGRSFSGYAWANLFTTWRGGLAARTQISTSHLSERIEGVSDSPEESATSASDERSFQILGVRQDWTLESAPSQLVKWGVEVRHHRASYGHDSATLILDPLFAGGGPPIARESRVDLAPSGWQLAAYAADRFQVTPSLTAEVGARWDRQTWTPGNDQISPRIAAVWELGRHGTLRVSWGRFAQAQGIHQLMVEDGNTTFFPAERAEHRIVSLTRPLRRGLLLRLETYRKTMTDLRPRFENLFEPMGLFPAGEGDRVRIDAERAEARGLELLLESPRSGRWSWWASYVYSKVEDEIDGAWQPRSWDQRHALAFAVNWTPGRSWNLNLAGSFHSGWPATPVRVRWAERPAGGWEAQEEVGSRNSDRYPSYFRLDLRASRTIPLRRGTLRYFLEILNISDDENVRATSDFQLVPGPGGSIITAPDHEHWIPILPSVGLAWEL